MPVTLSIKNAPDETVEKLKARAARHHRSLQGELMDIISKAANEGPRLTAADLLAQIRELGLETGSDSLEIIRAARDGR